MSVHVGYRVDVVVVATLGSEVLGLGVARPVASGLIGGASSMSTPSRCRGNYNKSQ